MQTDTHPDHPAIGRLEAVSPREAWTHEALDFTPWLLDNPDLLGEALGIDLAIERNEHPVGRYFLDLIGSDTATGETVIIENQLEAADHRHLGQLLTYAAGTDANTVVWIAPELGEEHRAALTWLNEKTPADTRFFGIEIRAWRIGDSPVAPQLHVVATPNGWAKRTRARVIAAKTQAKELHVEFWGRFIDELARRGLAWTRRTSGIPYNDLDTTNGAPTGAYFKVRINANSLRSSYIDPDRERLTTVLEQLDKSRGRVADHSTANDTGNSSMHDIRDGSIDRQDEWDEYIDWLIESQAQLRAAVHAATTS